MSSINTTFISLLTVMLCLTAPIMAGFVMPSDEVEKISYVSEDPIYLTSGLNNDTVSLPTEYKSYLNNQFVIGDGTFFPGGSVTTTPTNYPAYERGQGYYLTYSGSMDLSTLPQKVTLIRTYGDAEIQVDGHTVHEVYYYGKTGLAYAHIGNIMQQISTTITVIPNDTTTNNLYVMPFSQVTLDGKGYYVDPSKGLTLTANTTAWSNTQHNTKLSVVFGLPEASSTKLSFYSNLDVVPYVYIYNTNGTVSIDGGELGSSSNYKHILMEFDGVEKTLTFTGLYGLTNYTDSLENHKGNSVTINTTMERLDSFFSTQDLRYYVTSAEVKSINVSAMTDVTLDASSFYPGELWMFDLKGLNLYGDSFALNLPSGTRTFTVKDGAIVGVELDGVVKDVPLSSLTVAYVPKADGTGNTIRFNGQIWTEQDPLSPNGPVTITLNGTWKLDVSLAKLEQSKYSEYQWTSGTFNIDAQTYCMVGMLVSALMAILSGIAAYRFEIGGLIPVLIAGGIGTVYLLMMMSF